MTENEFIKKWKYRYVEGFGICDCEKEIDEEIQLLKKEIAYAAWRAAADAFRMYPNSKHTFHNYWETVK